ncbi:MAG TPA: ADOP family duplicated permease [Gemmatimonadaceae bacterium]
MHPIAWLRRYNRRDDFGAEITAHLALETDRLVAEGWDPHDAEYEARRQFGNVGTVQERRYDSTHLSLIEGIAGDVRYAVRTLWRDKTYLLAAVSALGIGLAANIALFALFNAVALQPLPVPKPDRILAIWRVKPPNRFGAFSMAEFLFYRDNARTLGAVAAAQPAHLRLAGSASSTAPHTFATSATVAEPVIALFVTTNYFETFGIRPVVGRGLRPDDEVVDAPVNALISDNYWERRFARDLGILGSTLIVSGIRATIVGVTPHNFAGIRQEVPDLWIPLSALGDLRVRASRETTACCELVGRLTPEASLAQAQSELAALAALWRKALPASEQRVTVSATRGRPFGAIGEQIHPLYVALQVVMLLVLLIACANVAGVLLGRAAAREREITIRMATGASRARLIRQLLTEGVVVSLLAGAVTAAITIYALATGSRLGAAFLSREGGGTLALTTAPNARVLIYVGILSVGAGILVALAPALQASRADLALALRSSMGISAGTGTRRLQGWLMAGQMATSVALLLGATSFTRSAANLLGTDPGFHTRDVISVWLTNPEELGFSPDRSRQIETVIRDRLHALPGVRSLAVTSHVPLGGNVAASATLPAEVAGDPDAREHAARYSYAFVSAEYFATLGIPLARGRTFSAQEVRDSVPVTVISDSLARAFWPGKDPIGRKLVMGTAPETGFGPTAPRFAGSIEVIGVVRDIRGVSMTSVDGGDIYLPKLTNGWTSRIVLAVDGNGAAVIRAVPRVVATAEPMLPVAVERMDRIVASDGSVMTARVSGAILALIGAIGLVLAWVGVYGLVSFSVRQREREIAIRMALGANTRHVLAASVGDAIVWIARGVAVGIVLGIGGIRVANAALGTASATASTFDPIALLVVPAALVALAVIAALVSGRQAASTDPAAVLRGGA